MNTINQFSTVNFNAKITKPTNFIKNKVITEVAKKKENAESLAKEITEKIDAIQFYANRSDIGISDRIYALENLYERLENI